MGLRFSDEGWNQLILRNYSIRWLIGDIETDSKLTRVAFHHVSRITIVCIVIVGLSILVNAAFKTLTIEEKAPFSINLKSQTELNNGTISAGLWWKFAKRGILFLRNPTVSVKRSGEKWEIASNSGANDNEKKLIIIGLEKKGGEWRATFSNEEKRTIIGIGKKDDEEELPGDHKRKYIVTRAGNRLNISEENVRGLFEDSSYFTLLLSCAFVSLSMRHMLRKFHKAFFTLGLMKRSDFEEHKGVFEHYRGTLAMNRGSGYAKWAILVLVLMTSICFLFIFCLPLAGKGAKVWSMMPQNYPWHCAVASVFAVTFFALVPGNMIWYGIGCAVSGYKMLNGIKKRGQLEVIPVSADGKGNLYVLGQFSFALFLMCISMLPNTLAWLITFGVTLRFMIGFPTGWLTMVFAFFYPLLPAHSVMKMAREKELKHISELFEECRKKYVSLRPGDADMDEVLAKMNYIETRYDRAKKMSVWPFNIRMLARFLSLVFLPIITFFLKNSTTIVNYIKSLMGKN